MTVYHDSSSNKEKKRINLLFPSESGQVLSWDGSLDQARWIGLRNEDLVGVGHAEGGAVPGPVVLVGQSKEHFLDLIDVGQDLSAHIPDRLLNGLAVGRRKDLEDVLLHLIVDRIVIDCWMAAQAPIAVQI